MSERSVSRSSFDAIDLRSSPAGHVVPALPESTNYISAHGSGYPITARADHFSACTYAKSHRISDSRAPIPTTASPFVREGKNRNDRAVRIGRSVCALPCRRTRSVITARPLCCEPARRSDICRRCWGMRRLRPRRTSTRPTITDLRVCIDASTP
jgi:hypothetical protein